MEGLAETDLERRMFLTGGGQAYACDEGLREDEAPDFLGGGGERMTQQQGGAAQVEFDLFVSRLVFPAHPVEPDQFEGRMGLGL